MRQDDDFILDVLRHVKPVEIVMHQLRQTAVKTSWYLSERMLLHSSRVAVCW